MDVEDHDDVVDDCDCDGYYDDDDDDYDIDDGGGDDDEEDGYVADGDCCFLLTIGN